MSRDDLASIRPFEGGRRLLLICGVVAGVGALVLVLGALRDPRRVLFSYLFAFVYWFGLALGALLLLSTFHATGARWPVVLRRALEAASGTLAVFPFLLLPVLAGLELIFPWASPEGLPERLAHQSVYLNVPFFLVRAAIYFAVWIAVSELLLRWSRRQDATAEPGLTARQRALASGSLPLTGLALSFATLDWLMSLDPGWSSTIYALYVFAGAFVAALAMLALVAAFGRAPALLGSGVRPSHFAALGRLTMGFILFWFYMAFCQYLLVWLPNLPEEIRWYAVRTRSGWGVVATAVVIGQFVVPFLVLLSREVKRRPGSLAALAIWILLFHALDIWWLVLPPLQPDGPRPALWDLAAFLALGGVAVAVAIWRLRGHPVIPVGDPDLRASLEYSRP